MATREASNGPDVVVVGGGIGGLSAAYALARAGRSVHVLEQADQFGEVGAGLQLAPNATRILSQWGMLDDVVAAGVLPRRLVLRDALSGDELTHLELGEHFQRRYGCVYLVVHRSDLHEILLDGCRRAGVELETSQHVERVESTSESAYTHCVGGKVYESSAVLGADGLNSTLRAQLVADEPIMHGYVAYRGTVSADAAEVEVAMDDVVAWIGPGRHLVQYPLRQRQLINQVAVFHSPAFDRGESEWGRPEELDTAFADSCDHVRTSLGTLWRDRWWPMYDRLPTDRWVDGRLLLIGDAAHPMLQYLAQGACQAIEDAHCFAEETVRHSAFGRVDWETALKATQQARAPRTAQLQRTARTWGEMWHVDGVARLLRNELFSSRDLRDYQHLDWLYQPSA